MYYEAFFTYIRDSSLYPSINERNVSRGGVLMTRRYKHKRFLWYFVIDRSIAKITCYVFLRDLIKIFFFSLF